MGWQTNPQLGPLLNGLQNTQPADTSASDDLYKQFFHGFLQKGKDVSDIGVFQPALQAGASRARMANESAGYGDSGIISANGSPDEQAVLNRQSQIGQERAKEGTGEAIAASVPGLVNSGTAYGAEEAANQNAFNLGKFSTAAGMINGNSKYQVSPWFSMLQGLAQGAGEAAMMAV